MGFIVDIFGFIAGNMRVVLFIIAVVAFFAAYMLIKPFADAVGIFAKAVAKLFDGLVTAFNDSWKKYPQFRVTVITVVCGLLLSYLVYKIWDAGREYERDICNNNNTVLELRRELADQKQRTKNAEFERDRNLQANIDAMVRQEELERQSQENSGEINELRERLKGNICVYPDDEYNRVRDILRGKSSP